MKKVKNKPAEAERDDMLLEYDFTGTEGLRGKCFQEYRRGHTVRIRQADGTVVTQYFTLEDGAVMLEPEVRQYFPDSESVNRALRVLISLFPKRPVKASKK